MRYLGNFLIYFNAPRKFIKPRFSKEVLIPEWTINNHGLCTEAAIKVSPKRASKVLQKKCEKKKTMSIDYVFRKQ